MKWACGISLADKYYYSPKGLEELEMLWCELRARDRRVAEGVARIKSFLAPLGEDSDVSHQSDFLVDQLAACPKHTAIP